MQSRNSSNTPRRRTRTFSFLGLFGLGGMRVTGIRGKGWIAGIASCILQFGGVSSDAVAVEWSDTSIGWRYGTKFREPVIDEDSHKNIGQSQHARAYKNGTNV